jgi:phospholipase/carboxylesterase
MLHGYGSNEEDLFSFAPELPEDLHIFSLRAPHRLEPFGYAWYAIDFSASRGKWNDVDQAIASRELVLETIDRAIEAYGLDPGRISLLGFSQGSILSYSLALSYPSRIKSVIALSGYLDPAMLPSGMTNKDLGSLNLYASHGDSDMVIPVSWARNTSEFLKELGLEHRYEEYPVGHGVCPENLESFREWIHGRY